MDIPVGEIQRVLDFMNWKMLMAVGVIVLAWVQFWKEYIPEVCCIGKIKVPLVKIFTILSGIGASHFIFDLAGVQHTETVALFHGVIGALFSALTYEVIKGTRVGLRSAAEMKEQPKTP